MRSYHTAALLVLLALMLLVLAACSGNPAPAGLTPIPTIPARVTSAAAPALATPAGKAVPPAVISGEQAQGSAIFARNCATCHGQQGEGGAGPNLRSNAYILGAGDQAVFNTLANGRPGTIMPAWHKTSGGSLSDQEIGDVIAFLHSLSGSAPLAGRTPTAVARATLPAAQTSPAAGATAVAPAARATAVAPAALTGGNASQGQALFGRSCTPCHGQQAEGGVGPALKNNAFIKTGGDQAIFNTIANGRPGTAMPAWHKSSGGSLTDQDIIDIIAFLKTLQS